MLFVEDRPDILERDAVVSTDPTMAGLRRTVARVAPAMVNILILGETGAGKEVFASMVHRLSLRASRPLVALNCACLPEFLIESELFGYERGAFTGAVTSKPGLLETADGGTVFLDEIGDMPLTVQAKLLRVIETRGFTRVGGIHLKRIDLRFVAATNHDLAADVAQGRFRADLYYRLNAVTLTVPPLRDHPADILPLAERFVAEACARFPRPTLCLDEATRAALLGYHWPGNVRELRNMIDRAALLSAGPLIEPRDVGLDRVRGVGSGRAGDATKARAPAVAAISDEQPASERQRIIGALEAHAGNQSRAAVALGVSRRTLIRKIAHWGLPRPRKAAL